VLLEEHGGLPEEELGYPPRKLGGSSR
jgi:hypothetical protein